ncbi:MAG: LamG domain-containing protein [Chthoniobacteraceae bacterium]
MNHLPHVLAFRLALLFTCSSIGTASASEQWWKPYDPDAPHTLLHASWNNGTDYAASPAKKSAGPGVASLVVGPHMDYSQESVNPSFGRCVRIGQLTGASLGDPSCLKYSTTGIISAQQGTIEFWFRPSIILADNRNRITFFKCGNFSLEGDPHSDVPGSPYIRINVGGHMYHMNQTFPQECYTTNWGWHHLALTYDFSDPKNGMVQLFIDGISVDRTHQLDVSNLQLGDTFTLGGNGKENYLTNGFYDELRISDVVREYNAQR